MGILINKEDFIGKWSIAFNEYTSEELDDFIEENEKKFIVSLLGAELGQLFIDDLVSQVPQTARFISIYNEFFIDDGDCVFISDGMKKMMLGFVFFDYVRHQDKKNTISGMVQNESELANQIPSFNVVVNRYNLAAETAKNIQWYICENEPTYPEYNGQFIDYTSGI
jgi:hypothetical protein